MTDSPATLALLPGTAVTFALGLCLGRTQRPETARQVAALIAELKRRGAYADLLDALDPAVARKLAVIEGMYRGQAWNQGSRPPG